MANIYDMADTWNAGATTFTAIKMNVTDTASAAGSLLMDLQVGGASKFSVSKLGSVTVYNAITTTVGNITCGNVLATAAGLYLGLGFDLALQRDGANILGQRNGTAAQTSNLYFSYTDASNYTRLALKTATGIHTLETESAGTGEANIDLALTPKGTGRVRFGTHAALGAETVSGYITIKDSGGVERKVAVVS